MKNEKIKNKKIYLVVILGLLVLLSIVIPSLARFRDYNTVISDSLWDGTTATSYNSGAGTISDPYVITNGGELAYFSAQLETNDYENTYFVFNNNILINNGLFKYDNTSGIQYILNDTIYYVDEYTNNYYSNSSRTGEIAGTINIFPSLNGFKGNLDAKSHTISGLYITSSSDEELGLFTNLNGNISNLYVANAVIYGGDITGGIASSATNAILNNILYYGYVINRENTSTKSVSISISDAVYNVTDNATTYNISLENDIPLLGSTIISSSLTGSYESNALINMSINNNVTSDNPFTINMGTSILSDTDVVISSDISEATVTLSNLKYNITYKYSVAGGIVGKVNNVTMNNTLNRGYVYSPGLSGGLIGSINGLNNISSSYNGANVNGEIIAGGLIGTIEKSSSNIIISKAYNIGEISGTTVGGLIGIIKDNIGSVSITNTIDASDEANSINTVNDTTVNLSNVARIASTNAIGVGNATGFFSSVTLEQLQNENYMIGTFGFNKYISASDVDTNYENIWKYYGGELPVLYFDDYLEPVTNINAGIYSWNSLSYEPIQIEFYNHITFSISSVEPLDDIYYYVHNSEMALNKNEIENINTWTAYTDVVNINSEGYSTIYVKTIDYDGNIKYLNSDILILDFGNPSGIITSDNYSWDTYHSTLADIYTNGLVNIEIASSSAYSPNLTTKYYISNSIISQSDLELLTNEWIDYTDSILLENVGTYVIYSKITNGNGSTIYLNTDYIHLEGYNEASLVIGRNNASYSGNDANISSKSAITLNISYANEISTNSTDIHKLMSNILLPIGTRIILIDYIKNKVYEYTINTSEDIFNYNNSCNSSDCENIAAYPLTLFKEVGANGNIYYVEDTYSTNGVVNENFSVILDFSNATINQNYLDTKLFLELYDTSNNLVRGTLSNTLKPFNIYNNTDASLSLTSDYSESTIALNRSNVLSLNIMSKLIYTYLSNNKIIDTRYEDSSIGLAIALYDASNNQLTKKDLENITFKIGNNTYYPADDGVVRIKLGTSLSEYNSTLVITTYNHNSALKKGNYYFKIANYISVDGNYYDSLNTNSIIVSANIIDERKEINHTFNVEMRTLSPIIDKGDNASITFNTEVSGLDNPSIKLALYQKDTLTAYNQGYTIINLASYVTNQLSTYSGYTYTIPISSSYELNLITSSLSSNGYKFVFTLYDGDNVIDVIQKYIIIK